MSSIILILLSITPSGLYSHAGFFYNNFTPLGLKNLE